MYIVLYFNIRMNVVDSVPSTDHMQKQSGFVYRL